VEIFPQNVIFLSKQQMSRDQLDIVHSGPEKRDILYLNITLANFNRLF